MLIEKDSLKQGGRQLRNEIVESDLVIVGGGLAGTCGAIAAARAGLSVSLVQDRPVLGGNASSEVRLWILGATSHMGNNNRWSREGGVIGEFMERNLYRNPEGNPLMVDMLLLEMVEEEPNIRLFLNTSVYEVERKSESCLEACRGFCSQNSILYEFFGSYFIDTSGDGILAFLAGVPFRMGAESKEEFGEKMAPDESYGSLLGHSLYFYSKDIGEEVAFHAPKFASKEIEKIAKYRSIKLEDFGCRLWWVEYGGRRDTVHDTEAIKWELWKVVYGIWDYIKNSGKFPEAKTHTLEWVGTIPGKRESRRFEGQLMLKQQDIVGQRFFDDVIGHGGWALDLHPADGVYSSLPGCNQWHSKGVYHLPLRAYLARGFDNLALGGRIISASHVAFGSTRVMATCACGAQGLAEAIALANSNKWPLFKLLEESALKKLHQNLHRQGQFLPHCPVEDKDDRIRSAKIIPSSVYNLDEIEPSRHWIKLNESMGVVLPVGKGAFPKVKFKAKASGDSSIDIEIRRSAKLGNFTPEVTLSRSSFTILKGESEITWDPTCSVENDGYYFLIFHQNEKVSIAGSDLNLTGVLTVFKGINKAVGNFGEQNPENDIGVDRFEFWCPRRRPNAALPALKFSSTCFEFGVNELRNGYHRPFITPGAWVADLLDREPSLTLKWDQNIEVGKIILYLDNDYDHAMESVLMRHSDRVAPTCVREIKITDGAGDVLGEFHENYLSRVELKLEKKISTDSIVIKVEHPSERAPAAIFGIIVLP